MVSPVHSAPIGLPDLSPAHFGKKVLDKPGHHRSRSSVRESLKSFFRPSVRREIDAPRRVIEDEDDEERCSSMGSTLLEPVAYAIKKSASDSSGRRQSTSDGFHTDDNLTPSEFVPSQSSRPQSSQRPGTNGLVESPGSKSPATAEGNVTTTTNSAPTSKWYLPPGDRSVDSDNSPPAMESVRRSDDARSSRKNSPRDAEEEHELIWMTHSVVSRRMGGFAETSNGEEFLSAQETFHSSTGRHCTSIGFSPLSQDHPQEEDPPCFPCDAKSAAGLSEVPTHGDHSPLTHDEPPLAEDEPSVPGDLHSDEPSVPNTDHFDRPADSHLDLPSTTGFSEPSPTGKSNRDQPSPTGEFHRDQPSPTGESYRDQPSPCSKSYRDQPSPTSESHRDQPSPCSKSNRDQPSPCSHCSGDSKGSPRNNERQEEPLAILQPPATPSPVSRKPSQRSSPENSPIAERGSVFVDEADRVDAVQSMNPSDSGTEVEQVASETDSELRIIEIPPDTSPSPARRPPLHFSTELADESSSSSSCALTEEDSRAFDHTSPEDTAARKPAMLYSSIQQTSPHLIPEGRPLMLMRPFNARSPPRELKEEHEHEEEEESLHHHHPVAQAAQQYSPETKSAPSSSCSSAGISSSSQTSMPTSSSQSDERSTAREVLNKETINRLAANSSIRLPSLGFEPFESFFPPTDRPTPQFRESQEAPGFDEVSSEAACAPRCLTHLLTPSKSARAVTPPPIRQNPSCPVHTCEDCGAHLENSYRENSYRESSNILSPPVPHRCRSSQQLHRHRWPHQPDASHCRRLSPPRVSDLEEPPIPEKEKVQVAQDDNTAGGGMRSLMQVFSAVEDAAMATYVDCLRALQRRGDPLVTALPHTSSAYCREEYYGACCGEVVRRQELSSACMEVVDSRTLSEVRSSCSLDSSRLSWRLSQREAEARIRRFVETVTLKRRLRRIRLLQDSATKIQRWYRAVLANRARFKALRHCACCDNRRPILMLPSRYSQQYGNDYRHLPPPHSSSYSSRTSSNDFSLASYRYNYAPMLKKHHARDAHVGIRRVRTSERSPSNSSALESRWGGPKVRMETLTHTHGGGGRYNPFS